MRAGRRSTTSSSRNMLGPGRRAVAAIASRADGRSGRRRRHGLELPMFARQSAGRRRRSLRAHAAARLRRVAREGLKNVAGLARMDASRLGFCDASFACVGRALSADRRARSGGDAGRAGARRAAGRRDRARQSCELAGLADVGARGVHRRELFARRSAGGRNFPGRSSATGSTQRPDMRLTERRVLPPFGLFTLTRIERLARWGEHARRPYREHAAAVRARVTGPFRGPRSQSLSRLPPSRLPPSRLPPFLPLAFSPACDYIVGAALRGACGL